MTKTLSTISTAKMAMTMRLSQSKKVSTEAEKKAVRKSSEKSEYRVSNVMNTWYFRLL